METMKKVKDAKLIFNAGTCRSLLKAGCQIIDVKPDRENPDKTVFVFKNDEHFQNEFERINKEIAEAKATEAH
jgi:translation initiation factor 1 (eIF-1/SUI1)